MFGPPKINYPKPVEYSIKYLKLGIEYGLIPTIVYLGYKSMSSNQMMNH